MNRAYPSGFSKVASLIIVVLVLGLAGVGYWGVGVWQRLVEAEGEVAKLRMQAAQAASVEILRRQNDGLQARVAELEKELAVAKTPPAPAEPAKSTLGTLASQLMANPAMREIMLRSQRQAIERRYADLMTQLNLSPEDRTRLVDLLAKRQANSIDIGLKAISGTQTNAERLAIGQQIREANASVDADIHELFGGDTPAYAAYQEYNAVQPVRTQATALATSLDGAGVPLSSDQANALTGVMLEVRRDPAFSRAAPDPAGDDPQTAANGPALQQYFQQQQQMQDQIADRAAAFLSPEQVTALRQAQAARLEQTRKSLDMARTLMGAGK